MSGFKGSNVMVDLALEAVHSFVEATEFEMEALHLLNEKRHPGALRMLSRGTGTPTPSGGYIALRFGEVYGKRVCYYEPTSTRVDWDIVGASIRSYGKPMYKAKDFERCIRQCQRN